MSWSDKKTPGLRKEPKESPTAFSAPEGFWIKCPECHAVLQHSALEAAQHVCTECQYHFRINARRRLDLLCDAGSFQELDQELSPRDFLNFEDSKPYSQRLEVSFKKTRLRDAFVSGEAKLEGRALQVGAFEFSFMGGSMGTVVGEKVARIFDRAAEKKQPAVIFQASGGARMQEGILSLMQMAKTSASLDRLHKAGLPYISVLTDPTTGGVAASFAMLGDVIIAEPHALVGFAGPRVIEQTISQKLPKDFQRSEFLLDHGMIDAIVPRAQIRAYLAKMLKLLVV